MVTTRLRKRSLLLRHSKVLSGEYISAGNHSSTSGPHVETADMAGDQHPSNIEEARHVDDDRYQPHGPPDRSVPMHRTHPGYYEHPRAPIPPPGYAPVPAYHYGMNPPPYMYPPHMHDRGSVQGIPETAISGQDSPRNGPVSWGPPSQGSDTDGRYAHYMSPSRAPYAQQAVYSHHPGHYAPPPGASYPYHQYGPHGHYSYPAYSGYGPPPGHHAYSVDPRFKSGYTYTGPNRFAPA